MLGSFCSGKRARTWIDAKCIGMCPAALQASCMHPYGCACRRYATLNANKVFYLSSSVEAAALRAMDNTNCSLDATPTKEERPNPHALRSPEACIALLVSGHSAASRDTHAASLACSLGDMLHLPVVLFWVLPQPLVEILSADTSLEHSFYDSAAEALPDNTLETLAFFKRRFAAVELVGIASAASAVERITGALFASTSMWRPTTVVIDDGGGATSFELCEGLRLPCAARNCEVMLSTSMFPVHPRVTYSEWTAQGVFLENAPLETARKLFDTYSVR
jgi:hypothetical protein